jgi:hypothetical protein
MTVRVHTVALWKGRVIVEGIRNGQGFRALLSATGLEYEDIDQVIKALIKDMVANDALTPAQMATLYSDRTIVVGSFTVEQMEGVP